MKAKMLILLAAACLVCASANAVTSSTQQPQDQQFNRYTVELRAGANTQRVVSILEANRVKVVRVINTAEGDVLGVAIDQDNPPDIENLRGLLPEVRGYGVDIRRQLMVLDDPIPDLPVGNETIPWGITAVGARDVTYAGGRKVCVIDTGYMLAHEDLPQTATGTDRGAGPWSEDGNSHGTHVAGTIGALGGNDRGVVGVIPDGAEFFIVRAFDAGGRFVYSTDLMGAMQDCATAGANVITMSLGGRDSSMLEQRIISKLYRQGILIVAAAGNGGLTPFIYPASYRSVLAVASVNRTLARSTFSQRNLDIDLAAPGENVLSTIPNEDGSIGYGEKGGTSMAAPHVAGVAALVWSNHKQCSNTEIAEALMKSALDLDHAGYDPDTGWGLVQAPAAMEYLAQNPCTGRR